MTEKLLACEMCQWIGPTKDCAFGDIHSHYYELLCPNCRAEITVLGIENNRIVTGDKMDPDQLPAIDRDEIIIDWCCVGNDTVIQCGELVLWREPIRYEGYDRFIEIAEVLQRAYGNRLMDIVPHEELHLFGDKLDAPTKIEAKRGKIRCNHRRNNPRK